MNTSRRILVTGADGFVGTWLKARVAVVLPSDELLAVGRLSSTGTPAAAMDVTCAGDVDDIVERFRPTCVVHLAAISSLVVAQAEGRRAWDINLFGTMNLAESVMRHVPDARFVLAGSSEVYGGSFNAGGGTVDETTLLDPRNPYATSKAAADLMLGQMAEAGLKAVRFRLFNHTGPGQSTRFAVPSFAAQIAAVERGERPALIKVGNIEARRDFLDVRDVVSAYLAAVTAPDIACGQIFNIASGRPRRIGDVLDELLAMSDMPIRVELDAALMRVSDVPVTAGDARLAGELLGWHPVIPWDTTLRDILEEQRNRP